MNLDHKFIIDLMEFKKAKLKDFLKQDKCDIVDKYFTEEDKKDILSWNNNSANFVCMELINNILDGYDGLPFHLCPFCLYCNLMCGKCSYGRRHGICTNTASNYGQMLYEVDRKKITKCITSEDYLDFLTNHERYKQLKEAANG